MAAQFNSWRYPVYLLLPVPLALVGAPCSSTSRAAAWTSSGVMGMLMLIGLSAKNAILYLDFVVERIGKMPFVQDALIEAARLRFRPIVMTTLTVLVISFPLILGKGEGSEFGQRMGIVMLGGIVCFRRAHLLRGARGLLPVRAQARGEGGGEVRGSAAECPDECGRSTSSPQG